MSAGDAAMACGIPSTSRFGITLVNSDPGPSVIRSALGDGFQRFVSGLDARGSNLDVLDAGPAAADARFALDLAAVGERRFKHTFDAVEG